MPLYPPTNPLGGALFITGVVSTTIVGAGPTASWNPEGLWAEGDFSVIRVDITGATGLSHGIAGLAGGAPGRIALITCIAAGLTPVTIEHESGIAAASERFAGPGGFNVSLTVGNSVMLVYDGDSSRWRFLGIA